MEYDRKERHAYLGRRAGLRLDLGVYGRLLCILALCLGLGMLFWNARPLILHELQSVQPRRHEVTLPKHLEDLFRPVSIEADDGVRLSAWYAETQNGATVILLHGYGTDRTEMLPEAMELISYGYGVFLYDSRAQGQSGGTKITFGRKEKTDLRAVVDWLVAQPEVQLDRLGAYGFSLGGLTLARQAAEDTRIKAVVLAASPTSLFDLAYDESSVQPWLSAHLRLIMNLLAGVNAYWVDAESAVDAIAPRPLLLIQGAKDRVVPPKRMQQLYAAAESPKTALLLAHSGHGYYFESDREHFTTSLIEFFHQAFGFTR
ncbi:MAG: alpha/beta hydrolase [Oligoflexus sp.]|jgi:dipeptidyl aminopeptidase/acylaminoacyl peptidase